jgi:Glycosyl hydrolase family 10
MKFLVYPKGLLQNHSEDLIAFFRSADGTVTPVAPVVEEGLISFSCETIDFASLSLSYPVEGFGIPLVTTGFLENKDEPCILAVELARGKISSLRNLLQEWIDDLDDIPDEFHRLHNEAYQLFTQAVFHQDDPEQASELGSKSLVLAFQASEYLCQFYINNQLILNVRSSTEAKHFGTVLNSSITGQGQLQVIQENFSRLCLPVKWNEIEETQGERNWDQLDSIIETCKHNSIRCYSNPLFDLSDNSFPVWLKDWQHDFESFISIVCDYVESVVGRYASDINVWNIARSFLSNDFIQLSQRDHLTIVAHALNTARQIQKKLLLGVSVIHPWGVSAGCSSLELSPLHAVDMLQRTGVGLSWVSLEIPMGYQGRGYVPYDLMELSRLIDEWEEVELPLDIVLAFPSSGQSGTSSSHGCWKKDCSEKSQQEFMEYFIPMLIQKENVMSVTWEGLTDSPEIKFPHSGLLREDGTEKPALSAFSRFRSTYGPGH